MELIGGAGTVKTRGNVATYDRALRHVSVRYTAESDRLKEDLYLHSRQAPSVFRFAIDPGPGLEPIARGDGSIDIVGSDNGDEVFSLDRPVVADQTADLQPTASKVAMDLVRRGRKYEAVVRVDRAWMNAPGRRFPIVVDPTVVFIDNVAPDDDDGECYISGAMPNASACFNEHDPDGELEVGWNGSTARRTLLRFRTSDLPLAEYLDTKLTLTADSRTTTASAPFSLHELAQSWEGAGGPTWARYDNTNPSATWANPGGDFIPTPISPSTNVGTTLGTYTWFPDQEVVSGWARGTRPNRGLLLKQSAETVNNIVSFESSAEHSTEGPVLSVMWNRPVGILPRYEFHADEPPIPEVVDDNPEEEPAFRFDVNVATGNLITTQRDLRVEASGLDVTYTRFLNSGPDTTYGWDFWHWQNRRAEIKFSTNLASLVATYDGSFAFYGPSGYVRLFQKLPSGSFSSPTGFPATLVRNPTTGRYRLTMLDDDVTLLFDSNGRLESETGSQATLAYAYRSDGRLETITDADGGVTRFHYNADGAVTRIVEPGGGEHRYERPTEGMINHIAPNGERTEFALNEDSDLTRVKTPQGQEYRFDYYEGGPAYPWTSWSSHRVKRITRVTDHQAGTGPTSEFAYDLQSQSTSVKAPDGVVTTYLYDRDKVVKESSTGPSPPIIFVTTGSLPAQDGQTLSATGTYSLRVDAYDSAGMRSIEVELDGAVQEDAETQPCPVTSPPSSCGLNWTLAAESLLSGEYVVTVKAIDNDGNAKRRSFLVIVPPRTTGPPSSDPVDSEAVKLEKARGFRQLFGFRSDDPYIAQVASDPSAQSAVAQFGVPLVPTEVAEMSNRRDAQQAMTTIDEYLEDNAAAQATYAGRYIDQAGGGTINIGFTQNASARVNEIAQIYPYPARLRSFSATRTIAGLESLRQQVSADVPSLAAQGIDVVAVGKSIPANAVDLGVANPTAAERQYIQNRYGASVLVSSHGPASLLARDDPSRRLHSGLAIIRSDECTAAFSARRRSSRRRYFLTTAGHCGEGTWGQGKPDFLKFGSTFESEWEFNEPAFDAQIITLSPRRASTQIYRPNRNLRVKDVETVLDEQKAKEREEELGQTVCKSGIATGVTCGVLTSINPHPAPLTNPFTGTILRRVPNLRYAVMNDGHPRPDLGDSGSPVYFEYSKRRARAVGILSGSGTRDDQPVMIYSHASIVQSGLNILICTTRRC